MRPLRVPMLVALVVLAAALAACDDIRDRSRNPAAEADLATPAEDMARPMYNFDLSGLLVPGDLVFNSDGACVAASADAKLEQLPVDIIWIVDNSVSMKPAVDQVTAGLNAFAALIAASKLDYRIVMLSLRSKTNPVVVGGGSRYAVCIPPPLAGGANCDNGPRFFQSSIDVRSTQPLEQFLGTLGQTQGYRMGESRGGEPWRQFLRPQATKTIVIVTDDNSRLAANDFLTYQGGPNPNNGNLTLPAGILNPAWMGLFSTWTFDGIYGWGDPNNAGVTCTYMNGSRPPAAGINYTTLVNLSKGVRAKICDGANAWNPFFNAIATAVTRTAKIACEIAIPPPPQGGEIDPLRVNVEVRTPMGNSVLPKVADAAACGMVRGWYYDNEDKPTKVILCPEACAFAQAQLMAGGGSVAIAFGCDTVVQ